MQSFTFHSPTEIIFGKGEETNTGTLAKKYGGNKIFVVYGGGSVVKSGLLDRVVASLAGMEYCLFGGVQPNPLLSHAREGVQKAIEFGADFILAVGGGSVIDTAKGIAHGAKNPSIDIWKFWKREEIVPASLPIGVVLTISAAGSETSNSAVLTDEVKGEKRGLNTEFNRPCFTIMNPELTYSVPKYHMAAGIADIMMHTMDRYFTQETEANELTDAIAAGLLRTMIKNAPILLDNPTDYNAASEIMWCGSLSHNGITGLGRPFDFSVHGIGTELSGRFDASHGATLTTMWGWWAQYVKDINPARFEKYARDVWGVEGADAGITATVDFFKSIGMPTNFTELGIGVQPDNVIEEMANSAVFYGGRKVGNFKPLEAADVAAVYRLANR